MPDIRALLEYSWIPPRQLMVPLFAVFAAAYCFRFLLPGRCRNFLDRYSDALAFMLLIGCYASWALFPTIEDFFRPYFRIFEHIITVFGAFVIILLAAVIIEAIFRTVFLKRSPISMPQQQTSPTGFQPSGGGMHVTITRSERKAFTDSIFRRSTLYDVTLHVVFTEEEKAIIKRAKLTDHYAFLYDTEHLGIKTTHGATFKELLKGPWTRALRYNSAATDYENDLKRLHLPVMKRLLERETPSGPSSTTIEL